MHGDGDGWVVCDLGHRHWGRHGAAGLLLSEPGRIVLQHRAVRTHEGGTWGLPGGARDSHEAPVATALREAAEEAAIDPAAVEPIGLLLDDHGGWGYTTVLARAVAPVRPHAANWESDDVRWCDLDETDRLPLHPGFAHSWPTLRPTTRPVEVIVDMANVVGSRPDGWWHDRAGANARLRDRIATLAATGLSGVDLPDGLDARALSTSWPHWVLVVEGAAASIADMPGARADTTTTTTTTSTAPAPARVRTVPAGGSGDDEIVRRAAAARDHAVVVVTADRGLRERLAPGGSIAAVGPSWLLGLLEPAGDDNGRPTPGG